MTRSATQAPTTHKTNLYELAHYTNVTDDDQTTSNIVINIKTTNDEEEHPEVAENNLSIMENTFPVKIKQEMETNLNFSVDAIICSASASELPLLFFKTLCLHEGVHVEIMGH